jgi:hypothetical protein
MLTVLAGAVWQWRAAASPENFWSQQQAEEYAAAHDAYHASLHDHESDGAHSGHAHEGEAAGGAPSEARQRFERIEAELQNAQFSRDRVGPLLMQIGVAAAIAFGVGYLVSRGDAD